MRLKIFLSFVFGLGCAVFSSCVQPDYTTKSFNTVKVHGTMRAPVYSDADTVRLFGFYRGTPVWTADSDYTADDSITIVYSGTAYQYDLPVYPLLVPGQDRHEELLQLVFAERVNSIRRVSKGRDTPQISPSESPYIAFDSLRIHLPHTRRPVIVVM